MDVLIQLITSLTKEESRHFKLYLKRIDAGESRKDEWLFDKIRTGGKNIDEDKLASKLYPNNNKNAYYRLKNRLQEMIGENLVLFHYDKDAAHTVFQYYQLHLIALKKSNYFLANYYLKKAEKIAFTTESYDLLDLIYSAFITLSGKWIAINPENYIRLQKENNLRIEMLRQINYVIAATHYRIMQSQNYAKKDKSLQQVMNKTIEEFSNKKQFQQSKLFQTKLFNAISQQLLQNNRYEELYQFSKQTYSTFIKQNWFDKKNHEDKLRMLIYTINALIRTQNEREALHYIQPLHDVLMEFGGMLKDNYYLFFINIQIAIYIKLDPAKALRIILEFEKTMTKSMQNYYQQFIILNKALVYRKIGRYNDGIRTLHFFYTNAFYKQSDNIFKAKVMVSELLMQLDADDFDSTKTRLEQVRKYMEKEKIYDTLKDEIAIMNIIDKITQQQNIKAIDNNVKKAITAFIKKQEKTTFEYKAIIDYSDWLEEYMSRKRVQI